MRNKIYAVTYSDDNYAMSKRLNLFTAKIIGRVSNTLAYGPADIDSIFYEKHKDILEESRGGGYWLWKPYIILKTLDLINYGEFLIYTDAGLIYVKNIKKIIKQLERDKKDVFLSQGFAPNKDWCKRDAFVLMGCDTKDAINRVMVSGGYILLRKTEYSIKFIKEWLFFASDRRILTDDENKCGLPNYEGFHEHRHDQSILTNLSYLWNIDAYKGVTHVDEPRAHYPVLKSGNPGAYGYTFYERVRLMVFEHELPGYKRSSYGRMFINTRIKDCSFPMFFLRLFYAIFIAIRADIWGRLNDKKYLDNERYKMIKEGLI